MERLNNSFKTREKAKTERNRRKAKGEYWNDVFRTSLGVAKRFYVGTYYGFINWEHLLKKG